MWEIIKEIIFAFCTITLLFFGSGALYLGIWHIKTKEGTVLDCIFYTGWGALVLVMNIASAIDHYFF